MNGLNVTNVTEPNEQTSGKPLTQSTLPTATPCPCDPAAQVTNWRKRWTALWIAETRQAMTQEARDE